MPNHQNRPERLKGSPKPDKILRDALIIELNREDEKGKKIKKVQRIVARLVKAGINGEISAIREIFDRVEGKAVQAMTLGNSDDGDGVLRVKWEE